MVTSPGAGSETVWGPGVYLPLPEPEHRTWLLCARLGHPGRAEGELPPPRSARSCFPAVTEVAGGRAGRSDIVFEVENFLKHTRTKTE